MFDVEANRHVYDVQVIDRNYISRTNLGKLPLVSIDHFDLTMDGKWLVTVDSKPTLHGERTSALKFWSRDSSALHTLQLAVDPAHQHPIVSLAVGNKVVVTAAGPQFKVWTLQDTQWTCTFAGTFQDLTCESVAISADDSIIAAAFQTSVTVWSTALSALVRSLPHEDKIERLSFVGRRADLVCASEDSVYVWDLLRMQGTPCFANFF